MSTLPRRTSTLGIYHVIIRGINKQCIFEDDEDYRKYLEILRKYQPVCGYKLLAYCLMSNHVHLLIKPGSMDLAHIFQHIGPSFVRWYNVKYQRVGHLFQSRYISKPVDDINYILTVIRYIHQNPVKAKICTTPQQYSFSSFKKYFDNSLIDTSVVLSMVSKEYFIFFNQMENGDECMDIDEERPRRLNDQMASEIMHEITGCNNVAEFQALPVERRNEALMKMKQAGISAKQASRITGLSYGLVKKTLGHNSQ